MSDLRSVKRFELFITWFLSPCYSIPGINRFELVTYTATGYTQVSNLGLVQFRGIGYLEN